MNNEPLAAFEISVKFMSHEQVNAALNELLQQPVYTRGKEFEQKYKILHERQRVWLDLKAREKTGSR